MLMPSPLLLRLMAVALLSTVSLKAAAFSAAPKLQQQQQFMASPPTKPTPPQHSNDETLREMQQKHRPIAASFVPSQFNPHPALNNCHLQTISGVFLRKNLDCAYIKDAGLGGIATVLNALTSIEPAEEEHKCTFWDERQRITTSCEQDFFTVDIKYAGERKTQYQSVDGKGMVVLIHGLESNSNSSISTDMGQAYVEDGFDVVCINFRGCCGSQHDTLGLGYHLGFTDDLRHFLKLMSELWEDNDDFDKRPIYLSGFSLGANVVIKCLGELGDSAMSLYNVHGAAVTGAPFDLERNIKCLDAPGFNRVVYSGTFLDSFKRKAQYQLDNFCDGDTCTAEFDYEGVMSSTTVAEYDDCYIAKIYGFENNIDYYRKSSCCYFLPGVVVPLFILNGGDDPFFDPDFYPFEESVDGGSMAPIKMKRTKHGGHLGYMFHQLSDNEKKNERSASWMPIELSRFISHVHHAHEADQY